MQSTDIDNTFLFNAIDNYDLYSKSQREVLKALIAVSIDDVASVHKNFLIEKLNLSKTTIYTILISLENENLITRKRLKNTRHDSYQINRSSLQKIIKLQQSKNSFNNK